MAYKNDGRYSFFRDLMGREVYTLMREGRWPSVRQIFDNLRCYPILALLSIALVGLSKADNVYYKIAFYFLIPWISLVSVMLIIETGILLALTCVGFFVFLLRLRTNPKALIVFTRTQTAWVRALSLLFVMAFVLFCIFTFLAMSEFLPSFQTK